MQLSHIGFLHPGQIMKLCYKILSVCYTKCNTISLQEYYNLPVYT